MADRKRLTRAQHRQEMLRELAAEEAVILASGGYASRAEEALEALERIRGGNYGICTDCGKRIPVARLQIKPEAKRCVPCQEAYEERQAQRLAG